jgi:hypothetical protein
MSISRPGPKVGKWRMANMTPPLVEGDNGLEVSILLA